MALCLQPSVAYMTRENREKKKMGLKKLLRIDLKVFFEPRLGLECGDVLSYPLFLISFL